MRLAKSYRYSLVKGSGIGLERIFSLLQEYTLRGMSDGGGGRKREVQWENFLKAERRKAIGCGCGACVTDLASGDSF